MIHVFVQSFSHSNSRCANQARSTAFFSRPDQLARVILIVVVPIAAPVTSPGSEKGNNTAFGPARMSSTQ